MKFKGILGKLTAALLISMLVFSAAAVGFSSFATEDVNERDTAFAEAQTRLMSENVSVIGEYTIAIDDSGNAEILKYLGEAEDVVIPESFEKDEAEYPTASIGCFAFSGCTALRSVKIPKSVSCVGDYTFENCRLLTKIYLDEGAESCNFSAKTFEGCSQRIEAEKFDGEIIVLNQVSNAVSVDEESPQAAEAEEQNIGEQQEIQTPEISDEPVIPTVNISSLRFIASTYNCTQGTSLNLGSYLSITPVDANESITWSVSDESIATVDANGTLNGLKVGYVKVYAETESGRRTQTTVYIRRAVTQITLSKDSGSIYIKSNAYISPKVYPSNAYNRKLTYTSSDTAVATVNSSGKVVGVSKGTAYITVRSTDGSGVYAIYTIEVKQQVTSITSDISELVTFCDHTHTLSHTVLPENANNKNVVYTSSSSRVAAVSSDGVVTTGKAGTAYITIKAADGRGAYKKIKVTVKAPYIDAGASTVNYYFGNELKIEPEVRPEPQSPVSFTFTSSNNKILTVDGDGNVTPIKNGTAYVTVKASSNYSPVKVKVNVRTAVDSISLANYSGVLYTGRYTTLKPICSPSNASSKSVKYTSSDPSVAKVSSSGRVTGVSEGNAVIWLTAADGQGAECCYNVEVRQRVTGISTKSKSLSVYLGSPCTLECTAVPDNAYNKDLTYTSGNTSVLKVDPDGVITPLKIGTAYVTVKAADGYGASVKITVTVKRAVSSITLDASKKSIYVGNSFTLKSTVAPSNATNKSVIYVSSDTSIVTVTSAGVVKAVGEGTATVTARAADGQGAEAQCVVTANQTTLTLNASKIPLAPGHIFRIRPTLVSTIKGVTVSYSSSNPAAATVDNNGIITGVSAGKAIISAATSDGRVTRNITVTVDPNIIHNGVDVSYIQKSITEDDWKKVMDDGYDFAMIRAGYGRELSQKDKYFEQNYASAKKAGIDVGVYHYSYATTVENVTKEANVMLKWLSGKSFEYPVAFDIEEDTQARLGKKKVSELIDTYCSILEENGYHVTVYSYANMFVNNVDSSLTDKYDVWVAHTNADSANAKYKGIAPMWQFNHQGKVNGINGNVDLNVCYVDYPSIIMSESKNGY